MLWLCHDDSTINIVMVIIIIIIIMLTVGYTYHELLHGVDHDTQEKIHNREEKSIHPQQLYN